MPDIIARLTSGIQSGSAGPELLEEALREIGALRSKRDALEELCIVLVRTGFPWDEEGHPTEAFPAFQERYHRIMHEAAELVGLEMRSTITRTEPRT